MIDGPRPIDRTLTVTKQVPGSWRDDVGGNEAGFVSLVSDAGGDYSRRPGWVSYEGTLDEGPEVEFICGGLNSKTPEGAAVWRQGNLMHFGFEPAPDEMSDAGRDLLVNAIVYIARFTEDRPIVRDETVFVSAPIRSRRSVRSWLAREDYPLEWFEDSLAGSTRDAIADRTRAGYLAWFDGAEPFLRPGAESQLVIDADAKLLGIRLGDAAMFERAFAAIESGPKTDRAGSARALLGRFAPEGPGPGAALEAWRTWLEANRPYLFWSEWGGYRWYVDPLARKRGVPTSELRGPARADAPDGSASR